MSTGPIPDIDSAGREVTGIRAVSEAIYRRLITPRGRLIGDPDYGLGLVSSVFESIDATPTAIAVLKSAVATECQKDERVFSIEVEGSFVQGALTLTITGESSEGPFALTLPVSAITVVGLNL
jgi:phage baseplate assembly protein W